MSNLKKYRILYTFNHSRMGFQNSITVIALDEEAATQDAKKQVGEVYGSKMLPNFSFKTDATLCGVAI
jgi:hypothetical protein